MIYLIGDLQGCCGALQRMLDASKYAVTNLGDRPVQVVQGRGLGEYGQVVLAIGCPAGADVVAGLGQFAREGVGPR